MTSDNIETGKVDNQVVTVTEGEQKKKHWWNNFIWTLLITFVLGFLGNAFWQQEKSLLETNLRLENATEKTTEQSKLLNQERKKITELESMLAVVNERYANAERFCNDVKERAGNCLVNAETLEKYFISKKTAASGASSLRREKKQLQSALQNSQNNLANCENNASQLESLLAHKTLALKTCDP